MAIMTAMASQLLIFMDLSPSSVLSVAGLLDNYKYINKWIEWG
jgi:hypothetical protein